LKRVAKTVSLDLGGAYLNLDAGVDSTHNRTDSPDLVVKSQAIDMAEIILSRIRRPNASKRYAKTGSQALSSPPHLRLIGLPLNRMECDLFGDPRTVDRLRQKAQRGLGVSMLREQKVNGLPGLIARAIQVPPLALDPDVRLIHPPAASDRALAAG